MIQITKCVHAEIIDHAITDKPIEACGYLAGKDGVITQIYRMRNVDAATDHFTFDPKEQFEVLKKARQSGLEIMANYHSHPESPARPSQEDIRLAFDPNILYFICSVEDVKNPVVKAFRIVGGEVSEETLEIVLV